MVCHYCYLIALKPSPMTASSNLIHHIFAFDEDSTPMKDVMVGNDLLWKQCVHVRSVRVYNYGSRNNRKRLIMADVFQRAELSCLMLKTFTWAFVCV